MTCQNVTAPAIILTRSTAALDVTVHDSAAGFAAWWAAHRPAARFLPFQDPRVMAVWERTIGAGQDADCRVLRLDIDGEPVFAAFFALRPLNRRGLRLLTFMDGAVCDYNAPILFEPLRTVPLAPAMLWRRIRNALPRHDRLELKKIPAMVKGAANPLWLADGASHLTAGHVMTLPHDWHALMEQKGKHKIVKAAVRNLRLLGEQGAVRMMVARNDAERDRLLDALIADKRAQLQRMGAGDLFARPGVEDFYRQCAAIEDPAITHLSGLMVEDTILATNMGFVDGERFCGVLTAFAQGPWARYSCGHLHLQLLLRWAVDSGLRHFDFGIGDEEYKKFWCDQEIALRDLAGPASVAGHAHDLFYRLRGQARAMLRSGRAAD